ncbi:alpha/beta fold hydrolase, partial [Streptomyces fulvoviolaceus]|uniref:alpha/beta fold hydrolase n=1 Tax=Streptomyces fulvoviolaceus TaxID=285535 RepID=UPI0021C12C58
IAAWLDSWPTAFASLEEATAFLGHEAWSRGLEERDGSWHPRFDRGTMIETMAEPAAAAHWSEWSRIRCPTLLVRGASGTVLPTEAADMLTRRPDTRQAVIPDAAHDVHLDRPDQLHAAIEEFDAGE